MDLDELREEIGEIDEQIVQLYEQRLELVRNVGIYKKKKKLEVRNEALENEKMNILTSMADGENEQQVRELFEFIFAESRKLQEEITENQ